MANPKKMSVEEILAACKKSDSGGGAAKTATKSDSEPVAERETAAAEPDAADAAATETATPAKKPAPAIKGGRMSVEEMLAAARAEKSGGAKPTAEAEPAAEKPAVKAAAAAAKPGGGKMSVQEMLAAARAEKAGGAKARAEKPAPKASPKSAAAAKSAEPAEKKPAAAAKAAGPKDTGSILAAARKAAKPGPMTKAEAAAKQQETPGGKPAKQKLEAPPMPEKPGYARPAPAAPAQSDRRSFMSAFMGVLIGTPLAVGFSTLAVTHLLWLLGLARFMFPNILIEPPTKFKVGFPDELAPGQVQEKYKALYGVWIVRYEFEGQPEIYALRAVCTHLGCTPNWLESEQKFKCPCHGSGFYKDGINFEGPAPRPLERYAIRLADDGQLEVDKSRTFFEEKGDWKDPASFVAV